MSTTSGISAKTNGVSVNGKKLPLVAHEDEFDEEEYEEEIEEYEEEEAPKSSVPVKAMAKLAISKTQDDVEEEDGPVPKAVKPGKKEFTLTQPGFEGVNLQIFVDQGETIYHDLDEDKQYTLSYGENGEWIYTDVETGASFYIESEEKPEDVMDREEMETNFNGSFDITISEGLILKEMIANIHLLSTSVYIVAKHDQFYFLMVSERTTVAQSSTAASKKTKARNSEDNSIYSIVRMSKRTNYVFNKEIDDPEVRAKSMIVMQVGGDILHSKVSSLTRAHKIRFFKEKGGDLAFETILSSSGDVVTSGYIDFTLRCEDVSDYSDSFLNENEQVGDVTYSVGYKVFCDAIKEVAKQSVKNSTIDICCGLNGQGIIIVNRKVDAEASLNHSHPVSYKNYSIEMVKHPDFFKTHREHRASDRIAKNATKLAKLNSDTNLLVRSKKGGVLLIADKGAMSLLSYIADM